MWTSFYGGLGFSSASMIDADKGKHVIGESGMEIKLPGGFTITVTKDPRTRLERPKCEECHREYGFFRKRHQCKFCGSPRCRDCIKSLPKMKILAEPANLGEGEACRVCWEKKVRPIGDVYKRFEAGAFKNVEIFPATYRGKIPLLPGSRQSEIRTFVFREKSEVETSLKFTAAVLGCDVVVDVVWGKGTDSEAGTSQGTHYFTVWGAKGVPAKLSKPSNRNIQA
jgi:hypothetical protein